MAKERSLHMLERLLIFDGRDERHEMGAPRSEKEGNQIVCVCVHVGWSCITFSFGDTHDKIVRHRTHD